MKLTVRRSRSEEPRPVHVVETDRGKEIKGDHLLGIVNKDGQLVVKLRREFLIVEDEA